MSGFAPCENCLDKEIEEDKDPYKKDPYNNVISIRSYQEAMLRSGTLAIELRDIYQECKEDNWDAQNAVAISHKTMEEALFFLDTLPASISLPDDATPAPDGSIDFEWYEDPRKLINVAIYGDGKIVYAGLFGDVAKTRGTEILSRDFPDLIKDAINKVKL